MSFEVQDLWKTYESGPQTVEVLRGVNLRLEAGESLAIVGASGVGKSTLLHCLGLIESVNRGIIFFNDKSVSVTDSDSVVESRRRSVGFVFQFHYLMSELTAVENVSIPLRLLRVSEKEALERSREILSQVGLSGRLEHKPHQLSGGEQQRVAMARALVHKPAVILADEPTGNLDPDTANRVFDVLAQQCERQKSILIMATHNLELSEKLKKKATLARGALSWV
jgi:lipoprotein-releasing system ATP-binding protein